MNDMKYLSKLFKKEYGKTSLMFELFILCLNCLFYVLLSNKENLVSLLSFSNVLNF